jgi:hypothetical protein
MASPNGKSQEVVPPSSATAPANETSRARSIATRLTETEFGEVEAAAANAGKKVAEWLREAALLRARQEERIDLILLTETMAICQGFAGAIEHRRHAEDVHVFRFNQRAKSRGVACPKASPEEPQYTGQCVMKLMRIRAPFPWRIAAILALIPCLPLLTSWAWIEWELPPLQRYYLAAYWDSSEGAKQPGAQVQIRWLLKTAPARKSRWLIASNVTDGTQNDLPLELSSEALGQGWTGIEKSPAQSINSGELEGLLREYFYDGQSLRQLANEPLL